MAMDANLSADRAHRGRGTLRPVTSPATGLDLVASWPVAHAAVGWRHRDGRVASVGDGGRRFALASVTKLLTASAVLMAVEEEIVVLDEAAGPPGATVRLLLAHASGLPFEGREPIAPPGERRAYGNAAYEVLAELVAERAQMPFADYLHEAVRSEEHTSELQSLMRISYAVFCLKKK